MSGIFDLQPLVPTYINDPLKMTEYVNAVHTSIVRNQWLNRLHCFLPYQGSIDTHGELKL